jgi:anhydro-N-acetylmuramic acid kinase
MKAGKPAAKSMIVAGVMSGTSADGVDVALARIAPGNPTPTMKVLGHRSFAYPKAVRAAVLSVMNAEPTPASELSRLHWRLGAIYADCIAKTCEDISPRTALALVGLHGQTIYHQATPARYLGAPVRATWQIGEASVIAEQLRVPVVSDFRPADLAAGGQGAPLVPMLDSCLLRSKTRNRVLLNLGGIANVTAIPAGGTLAEILAFDTGPANMVIDGLMQQSFGKPYDRDGKAGARGKVLPGVLATLLRDPYFAAPPPKSCGREQYGARYVAHLQQQCADGSPEDAVATATELTVASIRDAYARFCWPHLGQHAPLARTELIAAGGGTRNPTLMRRLTREFAALGVKVRTTDELGLASQAKEAVAFALLAWLSFHGLPGNVPSATGAARSVVLGKVTRA